MVFACSLERGRKRRKKKEKKNDNDNDNEKKKLMWFYFLRVCFINWVQNRIPLLLLTCLTDKWSGANFLLTYWFLLRKKLLFSFFWGEQEKKNYHSHSHNKRRCSSAILWDTPRQVECYRFWGCTWPCPTVAKGWFDRIMAIFLDTTKLGLFLYSINIHSNGSYSFDFGAAKSCVGNCYTAMLAFSILIPTIMGEDRTQIWYGWYILTNAKSRDRPWGPLWIYKSLPIMPLINWILCTLPNKKKKVNRLRCIVHFHSKSM